MTPYLIDGSIGLAEKDTVMHGRKITVDGQDFEWIVTNNVSDSPESIAAQVARGTFCGVVIWDQNRKQHKAPIDELSALPCVSVTPGMVETWIKQHMTGIRG